MIKKYFSTLRLFRQVRGFGQAALADRVGISQAMLSFLENRRRRPSPALRARLARVLGLPADELFPPNEAPK